MKNKIIQFLRDIKIYIQYLWRWKLFPKYYRKKFEKMLDELLAIMDSYENK